eukprot:6060314-Amphidinium_carterae.1
MAHDGWLREKLRGSVSCAPFVSLSSGLGTVCNQCSSLSCSSSFSCKSVQERVLESEPRSGGIGLRKTLMRSDSACWARVNRMDCWYTTRLIE